STVIDPPLRPRRRRKARRETVLPDPATAPPPELDADACHAIADDLQNAGRGAEAETFYRAALALAPERPDSWANLGLAILKDGRPEEAVQCERQALRLDPEHVEALNN